MLSLTLTHIYACRHTCITNLHTLAYLAHIHTCSHAHTHLWGQAGRELSGLQLQEGCPCQRSDQFLEYPQLPCVAWSPSLCHLHLHHWSTWPDVGLLWPIFPPPTPLVPPFEGLQDMSRGRKRSSRDMPDMLLEIRMPATPGPLQGPLLPSCVEGFLDKGLRQSALPTMKGGSCGPRRMGRCGHCTPRPSLVPSDGLLQPG